MFIFTERHGDGLPSNVGAADGSKASVWRRLDAPNPDYIPVTGLSSKGIASTGAAPTGDCDGDTKSHAVNALFLRELPQRATFVTESYRAQALAELLNDLREYRAASPAFRHYWRKLAMHDIARFKRDYLQPERAAFEAAIARAAQRRAA
jgi:hypothetical protein